MLRSSLKFGWQLFLVGSAIAAVQSQAASITQLQKALTFHASFDQGVNADFAKGDKRLFTGLRPGNQSEATPGLNTNDKTVRLKTGGLHGGALQFKARDAKWIFFPGKENVAFSSKDWSGTVSVWLQLDPEKDLDPGFTDPIQLTPRRWNDAAFFVDFDKEGDPRDFRLGAFPDLSIWNADGKNVNDIPEDQRPLTKVSAPPFDRGKWTHVAFTWERFNTGEKDGVAKLYLDGQLHGTVAGWEQTYTWNENEELRLFLGLNYIGLLDEVSCFNRALSADEVRTVSELGSKISSLVP